MARADRREICRRTPWFAREMAPGLFFCSLQCKSWRALSALAVMWAAQGSEMIFLPSNSSRRAAD
jgi:hypothetical protein